MAPNQSWNDTSELILTWSRGATLERLESFQPWVLVALKSRLQFDHAIWGFGLMIGTAPNGKILLAQVHRHDDRTTLESAALAPFEELARYALSHPGHARTLSMDEPACHLEPWGRVPGLCIGSLDAQTGALQFIAIGRLEKSPPFSVQETATLELLAPHMMQAYATRREISVSKHQPHASHPIAWSTAIVDLAGHVHNRDSEFTAMLEREWPESDGARLAEPLRKLLTKQRGARFRFVGHHIVAEFSPAQDLYLLSVRLRASEDSLSERERKIAQQYAAGASYKEIAVELQLSPSTVRAYVRTIFLKLGVNKKAKLANLLLQ